jgi:hypothetical protein
MNRAVRLAGAALGLIAGTYVAAGIGCGPEIVTDPITVLEAGVYSAVYKYSIAGDPPGAGPWSSTGSCDGIASSLPKLRRVSQQTEERCQARS